MSTIKASTRDASWYSRPNVSYPKKYHVVGPDGIDGMSACGRSLLSYDHEMEAEAVPDHSRCKRKGCKEKWP